MSGKELSRRRTSSRESGRERRGAIFFSIFASGSPSGHSILNVFVQRAATTLNIILMFSVVTLMTAGMQIATDSTAGERERKSLEPLLVNPVPRWQLITGKW